MKNAYKRDIGWGIFFLVIAIIVWIIVPFQIQESGRTHMGPRFFPKVISIIMASASIGLIINNLLKYLREKKGNKVVNETGEKSEKGTFIKEIRAVLVFLIMLVYAILMPLIGFIVSSLIICGIILLVLGAKKWYYYVIMTVAIFFIYYVFKYQLYVQLP